MQKTAKKTWDDVNETVVERKEKIANAVKSNDDKEPEIIYSDDIGNKRENDDVKPTPIHVERVLGQIDNEIAAPNGIDLEKQSIALARALQESEIHLARNGQQLALSIALKDQKQVEMNVEQSIPQDNSLTSRHDEVNGLDDTDDTEGDDSEEMYDNKFIKHALTAKTSNDLGKKSGHDVDCPSQTERGNTIGETKGRLRHSANNTIKRT